MSKEVLLITLSTRCAMCNDCTLLRSGVFLTEYKHWAHWGEETGGGGGGGIALLSVCE